MFATAWDEGLDEAQLAAVTHGDSPLVILAGAGTGKTRTLTARVARLLERGVPPERILLLTFTRRAADDMLGRAATMAGHGELARRLRGGTFHAVAHQFVAAWAEVLGLDSGFSLLDASDAADVMDLLRDEHGLSGREQRAPRASTLAELYSRCVNTSRPVAEVITADFPWCEPLLEPIGALCKAYVTRKRERSQLDFDDLLLYFVALLDERLGSGIACMFDYVLVDEYQDVNPLQVEIVRRLRPDGSGLTVVGDDAQAIYGFRGADAAHLHQIAAVFPDTTVVALEQNFRSVQPILDLANHMRPLPCSAAGGNGREAAPHHALVLRASRPGGRRPRLLRCHDAASEAREVVDQILERHHMGRRLLEQAVLVRASHHSDLVELELSARRVPYRKYGGLRFIEAAHVKDFAASERSCTYCIIPQARDHDAARKFGKRGLSVTVGPSRVTPAQHHHPPPRLRPVQRCCIWL